MVVDGADAGENEDSWRDFLRKLKRRGLRRVRMFISDPNQGIQAAVKKERLRANWQRCKVHRVIA